MHPFGRFPDATLADLARVAVIRALDDAGLGTKELDAVYVANGMAGLLQGQEQILGQVLMRDLGIERIPVVNVENACASGSTAMREAIIAIRAGVARTVLVLGVEKMFVDDRDRTLSALETAADTEVLGGLGIQFTALYAMRLRDRLDEGELTVEHLGAVAAKNHRNGALNPNAHHRRAYSTAEVLASKPIADPLTLLMCSSFSDGAAAVVVATPESGGVGVRAAAAASGFTPRQGDDVAIGELCARLAYEEAGLGPEDVDIAEVHDAMAPGELLYYEQLGFCAPGEAAAMLDRGDTALGGRIPVNASGGLTARGHPVGATGIAQIAELTWQLRGQAGDRQAGSPRIALAQNSGGWISGGSAACNVHILEGRSTGA
jgi:acetyl-CoA acetyltransferase